MTTFTPGKYRMANGEQAIVVCDVGENPIGKQDMFPFKGFIASGSLTWTRQGTVSIGTTSPYDLLEPWTDPPTLAESAEMLVASLANCALTEPAIVAIRHVKTAIAAEKARTANA